jgi:hypothetical protein
MGWENGIKSAIIPKQHMDNNGISSAIPKIISAVPYDIQQFWVRKIRG